MKGGKCMKRFFISSLFLIAGAAVHAQSPVLINEVASEEPTPPGDWVEFYVASGPVNLANWKVFEQNTLVKTFPNANFTFSSGAYIILNFNSSSVDETTVTGDSNGNGVIDVYSADAGLTGTSNVISLRNSQGLVMDAVVFSDSASWTSTQQSAFNLVVSSGQWPGTLDGGQKNFSQSVNVPGGIGQGNSIGRKGFTDTNSSFDWHYFKGNSSKGLPNPAIITCQNARLFEGTITEVAPSLPISAGGDYVELYFKESPDVCGGKLFEGPALIKTLPSATPNRGPFGPFILLHASVKVSASNLDETDAIGDMNGNGAIDLYSEESNPGLTGSADDTISLESSDGLIIDFMSFSDKVPLYGAALQGVYNRAAANNLWQPECSGEEDCYSAGSVAWSNSTTKSLSKKLDASGDPKTSIPSSADDWEAGQPTPGKRSKPSQNIPKGPKFALHITQSPFSPLGDGVFKEALIQCNADDGSKISLKLFDIRGRLIRTLADRASLESVQSLAWDGRDADGQVVPMGVYLVWMEIKLSNGDVSHNSETVVVGRKL